MTENRIPLRSAGYRVRVFVKAFCAVSNRASEWPEVLDTWEYDASQDGVVYAGRFDDAVLKVRWEGSQSLSLLLALGLDDSDVMDLPEKRVLSDAEEEYLEDVTSALLSSCALETEGRELRRVFSAVCERFGVDEDRQLEESHALSGLAEEETPLLIRFVSLLDSALAASPSAWAGVELPRGLIAGVAVTATVGVGGRCAALHLADSAETVTWVAERIEIETVVRANVPQSRLNGAELRSRVESALRAALGERASS